MPLKYEIKTASLPHLESFQYWAGLSTQEEDTTDKVIRFELANKGIMETMKIVRQSLFESEFYSIR